MSYFYSLTYTLQNKPCALSEQPLLLEKICLGCKKLKPRDEFSNHILGVGGLTSKCKECLNRRATDKKRSKKNKYKFQ